MREDVDPLVLEPERGINNIYETRIAGNEGWNPQDPCLPMRWMADEAAPMTLSRSISAWNYIQLPTPCSSRIFKHQLPINQNPHLYTNDHHHTAYISQPPIIMPSPYSNMSFFDDPSDIEMEYLSLPKQPLQIKKSLWLIRSTFQCDCAPVKELPGIPLLTLNDNLTIPNIPIDPLFPPRLQPKPPYHLGEDISEIGTGTRFVGIEA